MRVLARTLVFGFIFLAGCGGRGKDGSGRPVPNTESDVVPVNDASGPSTYVLTNSLPYLQPVGGSCLRYNEIYGTLPDLKNIKIDGRFLDWEAVSPVLTDPLGDAPSEIDFGTVSIGRTGDDLALAISIQRGANTDIYLEFGGVLLRGGQLTRRVRSVFRVGDDGLFEFISDNANSGKWQSVRSDQFKLEEGPSGVELILHANILGDVLSWPAFWTEIHTQIGRDSVQAYDAGSSAVFASVLHNEASNIGFSGCYAWQGQNVPVHLRFVLDRATELLSRHKIEPPESVASWAFSAVRTGFDATAKVLGNLALPTAETTVYLVNASVSPEIESIGPNFRPDRAYDGLLINTTPLAEGSTDYFPQGQVLSMAVAHAVRLHLLAHFPAAPHSLLNTVTQAISDGIIQQTLGMSYWLDRYNDQVAQFLARRDDNRPKPLNRESWVSKEQAFGHLLGSRWEPVALRDAWMRAAELARAGNSAEASLLSALREKSSGRAARQRLERLWSGWITEGNYAEGLGPDLIADEDSDGLPKFLEDILATRADQSDTDGDGWTDYAEFIGNGDPLAETINPSVLIPDGDFSDWLELLPKKVIIDRGHAGACPRAADISHYAAIAGHEELLVGAYASDFLVDDPKAHWELVVDLPNQQAQLLVSMAEASRRFVVKNARTSDVLLTRDRAPTMGRGTIEIPLSRSDLGLQPWTIDRGSLRLRLRTIFNANGEEVFCDETPWFSPEFNQ